MSQFKNALKREDGISTIELVISAALGLVIALGIFTIFVNVLEVSENTSTRTLATSNAQTVSSSLVSTLRNSDQATVTPLQKLSPTDTLEERVQVLRARTASGTDRNAWVCTTWVFGPDGVFQRTSDRKIENTELPTAENRAGWGLLATGIEPNLPTGSGSEQEYINSSSTSPVILSYTIATGKGAPLAFSNKVQLGANGTTTLSTLNCG